MITYDNGALVIPHFLSDEECDALIKRSESIGYEGALIQTRGPSDAQSVRSNERILFDDYELAKALFLRIKVSLPKEIDNWQPSGLNEKFRFYKYTDGQYFKWHVDGSFKRDYFEVSKLTAIFYLNTIIDAGGETEFEDMSVSPEKGKLLLFPHKLRHQGVPPASGVKYVLRTDVMYAKT